MKDRTDIKKVGNSLYTNTKTYKVMQLSDNLREN